MRFLVHPAVVLTTSLSPDPSTWRAITLSSFNSLSIPEEPGEKPLISFNIKTPSIFSKTLHQAKSFLLHVMLPTKRAAEIAERFASPVKSESHYSDEIIEKIKKYHMDIPGFHGSLESPPRDIESSDDESSSREQSAIEIPWPFILPHGHFSSIPLLLTSPNNHPKLAHCAIFVLYCCCCANFPINVSDHELWVACVDSIDYNPHSWTNLPRSNIYDTSENLPLALTYGDRMFRSPGVSLAKGYDDARRMIERKLVFERSVELTRKLEKISKSAAGDKINRIKKLGGVMETKVRRKGRQMEMEEVQMKPQFEEMEQWGNEEMEQWENEDTDRMRRGNMNEYKVPDKGIDRMRLGNKEGPIITREMGTPMRRDMNSSKGARKSVSMNGGYTGTRLY